MNKLILTILALLLAIEVSYAQQTTKTTEASPNGGMAGSVSPFLSESFQTDLATGAATLSIPITIPPGRKNMQPKIALSYSSNNSNGICGVGWGIPMNCIQRSTKDGVPNYDETDSFIFVSSGSNAELIHISNNEYRAKIESAFMRYLFNGTDWLVYDKSGTKYTFGLSSDSRLDNGDKVFAWYLERVEDVYGNYITYRYQKPADGQIYLKEIRYTGYEGDTSLVPDKSIIFDYAEDRPDKIYSYRSGWQVVTTRRLISIVASFVEDDVVGDAIWIYDISYGQVSPDTGRTLLRSIAVKDKAGVSLPPKTFTYQRLD